MDPVEVDGSFGEGGGQVLRTAVVFSVIQGKPIHVSRIRAGRPVPGLRQQHLSTLEALSRIFRGSLEGGYVGSSEISFAPGGSPLSEAAVDMKTAASTTLLLQAVVPAVALSGHRARLQLTGGTDVPWSPTFDYMSTVVRDAYRSIGVSFNAEAISRGYYPRGGGRVTVEIEPASRILPTVHTPPEASPAVRLSSRCGKLPRHVAERQLAAMQDVLASRGVTVVSRAVTVEESLSPGSSCLASAVGEGRWIGADGIGAKGRPAEDVGKDVGTRMCSTLETGASFDQNLADMIAPLLALAPGPSFLLVPEVTLHLRTCMQVASLFTGCSFTTSASGRASNVHIFPGPRHNA